LALSPAFLHKSTQKELMAGRVQAHNMRWSAAAESYQEPDDRGKGVSETPYINNLLNSVMAKV
jgi:hypothetical protein